MFNKFNQKDDPLLDSVRGVIDTNEIQRQATAVFNESLGIQDRKQLPHELLRDYDRELGDFTAKSLNEGVVPLVELSKNTLKSYVKKAKTDRDKLDDEVYGTSNWNKKIERKVDKINNRQDGMRKAKHRLGGKYHPKVQKYGLKEEEQLDEISDKTKHSYVRAAAADIAKRGKQVGYDIADASSGNKSTELNKRFKKNMRSVKNRETGIKRAVGKNELAYVKDFMAGAKQGMSEEQLDEWGNPAKKLYKAVKNARKHSPEREDYAEKLQAKQLKLGRKLESKDFTKKVNEEDQLDERKDAQGNDTFYGPSLKQKLDRLRHMKATKAHKKHKVSKEREPEEHGVEAEREMASKGQKMYEAFGSYIKKDDPTDSKRGVRGGTSKGKRNFMLANKIADKLSKKADKMNAKDAPKGPVRIAEDELNERRLDKQWKKIGKGKYSHPSQGTFEYTEHKDGWTSWQHKPTKSMTSMSGQDPHNEVKRRIKSLGIKEEAADIDTVLEEIAANLYAEYEYVCENYDDDDIQSYIDSLSDEQYEILEATAPIPRARPAGGDASSATLPSPQASSFRPAQSTAGQGVAVLKGVSQYIKDAGAGKASTKNLEYATAASRGAATGNKVQDIGGKKIDVSKWAGGKEPAYVKAARDAAASAKAKPAASMTAPAAVSTTAPAAAKSRLPTPAETAREKDLARQKGENDAGDAEMRAVARRRGVKANVAVRGPEAQGGPGGSPNAASTEANLAASVALDNRAQEAGAPEQIKSIDSQTEIQKSLAQQRALKSLGKRPGGGPSRNRLTRDLGAQSSYAARKAEQQRQGEAEREAEINRLTTSRSSMDARKAAEEAALKKAGRLEESAFTPRPSPRDLVESIKRETE